MPIYAAKRGDKVILERWSIREVSSGARHFVGFNIVRGDGRVSTPIVSFDPVTRTGRTITGSTYELVGRAGRDNDAEYVWGIASKAWKIEHWRDVTSELVTDWREPLPLHDQRQFLKQQNNVPGTAIPVRASDNAKGWCNNGSPIATVVMDPIRFRARAYAGDCSGPDSVPVVSELAMEGALEYARPIPHEPAQKFLLAVRSLIHEKATREFPIADAGVAHPVVTVLIEKLERMRDPVGELMARIAIAINESTVHATLYVGGQRWLDAGPLRLRKTDGIWEVVLRLLPDFGDSGPICRWEAK